MRLIRPLSAAVAALALGAGVAEPATAQVQGAGTSLATAQLLGVELGDAGAILDLALVVDEAQSTIDGAVSAPGSYSRLGLGSVSSTIVATDPVNQTLPAYEAKSSGPTSQTVASGPLGLAAPVLDGTVQGGTLSATLEDGVARAVIDADLAGVTDAVGGLIDAGTAGTALSTEAAGDHASARRSATVADITVLDLGALLQGLGVDLGSLTVDQLAALVDGLAVQAGLPLPSGQATLAGAVAAIDAAIDDLQTVAASSPADVTSVLGAVDATTADLLADAGITAPLPTTTTGTVTEALTLVNDVIDALQAELQALVADGVRALDDAPLLGLGGVDISVATKALADVNASTATVAGTVGEVKVGTVTLANGLDVLGASETLSAAAAGVNAALGSLLASVHPELGGLLEVAILEDATEVATRDGYTTATAGLTALSVRLTPPATLAAVVSTVNALSADAVEVADVLGVSVEQVSSLLGLDTGMDQLAGVLSLGFGALSQPATIRVAQLGSASNYRAGAVAPPRPPMLPTTGADTMALAAGTALAAAIAGRRLLLGARPRTARVRVER